jgi:uncharacterized protein YehS (DUF1456 family)
MNNNDILRRVRYILDLKDNQITKIFKHVGTEAPEQQVNLWLKREDEAGFVELTDELLIDFLDALVIEKRGKKDGPSVRFKQKLDNNLILMKLKIAFHLKSEEALEIMELAEFKISKHEFSALFRKKDHKHYRVCKNQLLRKFMKGLQNKYRGKSHANVNNSDDDVVKYSEKKMSRIKPSPIKTSNTRPLSKKTLSTKPASSKPASSKPTSSKPTSSKPTSSKPTSSKPASYEPSKVKTNDKNQRSEGTTKSKNVTTAASVWKIPKK